jgi:hypothetical protein
MKFGNTSWSCVGNVAVDWGEETDSLYGYRMRIRVCGTGRPRA